MSGGKVIYLAYSSPSIAQEELTFHCCKRCRNKTFTLIEDRADMFPELRCAACGNHIGRIGFANDEDAKRET